MRVAICALLIGCTSPAEPPVAIDIAWQTPIATVGPRLLGHNAVWSRGGLGLWDDATGSVRADVQSLVTALAPGLLRFPGGTRAMMYHFDETIGPVADRRPQCDTFTGALDATSWGMDEALRFAEQLGAEVTLVTPWYDGTPERAAAMVAYAVASPDSGVVLGVDAGGHDWGTAGAWGARRAANGHPAPYPIAMVEIGNEQYLTLSTGKDACGTTRPFSQAERLERGVYVPSTARDVAQQVVLASRLIKQVNPTMVVGAPALTDVLGAPSDPATAISDVDTGLGTGDAWNPTLAAVAGADYDAFVLHVYSFGSRPERVRLADELRATVQGLRGLGGSHTFAVTEFGTLFDGDTQLNALLSADFVRVAAEEHLIANLRHILIEDRPAGLFATSAAILGADHAQTPGYSAMALLAAALRPIAVAWQSPDPELVVLATRDDATQLVGIVVIDRRLASEPVAITLPLPPGTWRGELAIQAAPNLTSADVTIDRSEITAERELAFTLPANGLAVIRLAP